MQGPYSFLISSRKALEAVSSLAAGRGVVINPSKLAIERSFRRPYFPSDDREFQDLLLNLGPGNAGVHLTHAEYDVCPSHFGDPGESGSYSFFLDIDGRETLSAAGRLASTMAEELSRLEVPHWVKFSGSKGFHIHIPSGAFPRRVDGVPFGEAAPGLFLDLKHMLIRRSAARCKRALAASVIHPRMYYPTSQGIQRLPFSRHETTGLLALPLGDDEVAGYEPEFPGNIDPGEIDLRARIISTATGSAEDLITEVRADSGKPPPLYHRR